jgi:hypothetical protein
MILDGYNLYYNKKLISVVAEIERLESEREQLKNELIQCLFAKLVMLRREVGLFTIEQTSSLVND